MRTQMLLAISMTLFACGSVAAEPCVFGTNRPAIDTMKRNITPGGTVIVCEMKTVTMRTPSGNQREVKIWTFQKAK